MKIDKFYHNGIDKSIIVRDVADTSYLYKRPAPAAQGSAQPHTVDEEVEVSNESMHCSLNESFVDMGKIR
jgi:hypothetical protein